MLNKKIKAALFIFLVLFCIAAVNAESDMYDTDFESVETMNLESENYAISTVAESGNSVGTFSELNTTINGNNNNTIYLDKDYTYNESKDGSFKNGVEINRNLVIDGQGNTINGNHMARIFKVMNSSLTIKNINLINGHNDNDEEIIHSGIGGAIYNDYGNLTIINSTFNNNYAYSGGGAVYSVGHLEITNSKFMNNSALEGGAVWSDGDFIITSSDFDQNNAEFFGGAVSNYGNMTINNSNFTNNTSTVGGAISSERDTNITVTNSKFIQNSADYGGAIDSEGNVTVIDSEFALNTAGMVGGAIDGTTVNVINSLFTQNTAGEYGGALISSEASIINSTFILNTVEETGGAISIGAGKIVNSTFINNAASEGGAISISFGNVIIDNSKFIENKAILGGAISYINTDYIELLEFIEYIKENPDLYEDMPEILEETLSAIEYHYKNVSITIINSDFTKNEGEFGDDIYAAWNTTVLNNKYTENSYSNIYANNTIINGTVVIVLGNSTYYVTSPDFKFKINATAFADGASVAGYNLVITDGINTYETTYMGYGVYEITNYITAFFKTKTYSAVINDVKNSDFYTVENGTVISNASIILEVKDVIKYYGNDKGLTIKLTDTDGNPLSNKTVTITINGKTYTRVTDANGTVSMNINLNEGIYEAIVSYGNFTVTSKIAILSTIESNDVVKLYRNGTQYYATFLDSNGNPIANTNVTFNINGVFYTRTTNKNGIAQLNINLNTGKYIITAINPITKQSFSNNITVLSTISGDNIVKYYRNGTQYYATFYDSENNPLANTNVTFNINGVFYTRTTDEDGIAMLSINLNPGEYIITAINPENNQTYSNTVKVLSVIDTEDLEMTPSSRLPFEAAILGENGEPLANATVSFNINGVFYSKTTDENGVASLNINLVAGKYIITTMYNDLSVSNTIIIM